MWWGQPQGSMSQLRNTEDSPSLFSLYGSTGFSETSNHDRSHLCAAADACCVSQASVWELNQWQQAVPGESLTERDQLQLQLHIFISSSSVIYDAACHVLYLFPCFLTHWLSSKGKMPKKKKKDIYLDVAETRGFVCCFPSGYCVTAQEGRGKCSDITKLKDTQFTEFRAKLRLSQLGKTKGEPWAFFHSFLLKHGFCWSHLSAYLSRKDQGSTQVKVDYLYSRWNWSKFRLALKHQS